MPAPGSPTPLRRPGAAVAWTSCLGVAVMLLTVANGSARPRPAAAAPPPAAPPAAQVVMAPYVAPVLLPVPTPTPSRTPSPRPSPSPKPKVTRPPTPRVSTSTTPPAPKVYHTWARINRSTGAISGSNASRTAFSESTVKIWLAADFLRAHPQPTDDERAELSTLIRDSDNAAADRIWRVNGGNGGIARMIKTCKLTDTKVYSGWWSKTMISARDLARLGLCVTNGAATGETGEQKTWAEWVLNEMRHVRGSGLFGIKLALPPENASVVGIKNGWFNHGFDGQWLVHCLGVHPDWSLAILTTYPSARGRTWGEKTCENVTRQVLGLTP